LTSPPHAPKIVVRKGRSTDDFGDLVPRKKRQGLRLTERDLEVLGFVVRHGFATAEQVGSHSFSRWENDRREREVSMTMVYRRLKKLVEADLLKHEYVLHGRPGVYLATRRCADLVDAGVPPAKVDLKSFDHDLAVVDLALALGAGAEQGWITEREIRSKAVSDARGGGGRISRGGRLGRVPDGLLVGRMGERWAVELEISGKDNARYLDIFRGYVGRHRERMPEGAPGLWPEEQLADYVEGGGEVDGVAWYFWSGSKLQRARDAPGQLHGCLAHWQTGDDDRYGHISLYGGQGCGALGQRRRLGHDATTWCYFCAGIVRRGRHLLA